MKENILHVVSSLSSKGRVAQSLGLLRIKENVTYLPTDFSFGHIPKDFSDKELCFSLASRNQIDGFYNLKEFITTDYSRYQKVIVWHGWSAYDLLLLYLMSVITDDNLYQIDIRDCDGFMQKHLSHTEYDTSQYPVMGYVCIDDIIDYDMLSYAKPVSKKEQIYYRNQWDKWANSPYPYRFSDIHKGIIKEYPENFMDPYIIDAVENSDKLFVIIGEVMSKLSRLFIPDFIIYRRILQLQHDRVLKLSVSLNENK